MSEPLNVAAEIAKLRGDVNTALARIEGRLDTLVTVNENIRTDIDDLEGAVESLDDRVKALEARRWPLGPLAALSGVVSALVAALAYVAQL